jgi:hypothetical protein
VRKVWERCFKREDEEEFGEIKEGMKRIYLKKK